MDKQPEPPIKIEGWGMFWDVNGVSHWIGGDGKVHSSNSEKLSAFARG